MELYLVLDSEYILEVENKACYWVIASDWSFAADYSRPYNEE